MEPIVSYRRAATGVWGYRFFQGKREVCQISTIVGPNSMVRIDAPGISWHSTFNIDNTIIPGISRRVKDNDGKDVFRIIYCEPGFYRIVFENRESLLVERREGKYLYGVQGEPVLAQTERIEGQDVGDEYSPYFQTTIYEDVQREKLLSMLAFPILRFY